MPYAEARHAAVYAVRVAVVIESLEIALKDLDYVVVEVDANPKKNWGYDLIPGFSNDGLRCIVAFLGEQVGEGGVRCPGFTFVYHEEGISALGVGVDLLGSGAADDVVAAGAQARTISKVLKRVDEVLKAQRELVRPGPARPRLLPPPEPLPRARIVPPPELNSTTLQTSSMSSAARGIEPSPETNVLAGNPLVGLGALAAAAVFGLNLLGWVNSGDAAGFVSGLALLAIAAVFLAVMQGRLRLGCKVTLLLLVGALASGAMAWDGALAGWRVLTSSGPAPVATRTRPARTATPSRTARPSATAPRAATATASATDGLLYVREDSIAVRAGPGADFDALDYPVRCEVLMLLERKAGVDWWLVESDSATGYVSRFNLTSDPAGCD